MWWILLLSSLVGVGYVYLKNTEKLRPRGVGFKVAPTPKEDTLTQLETLKKQEEAENPQNTNSTDAMMAEALIALEADKEAEAEKLLAHILAVNQNHVEANQKLGMLYLKNGLASKSEPFLRAVVEMEGDNPSHLSNLGYALFMQNRLKEAKNIYEEALALDSSRGGRFASLAQVHMAMREFDVAMGFIKKALSLESRNSDFLLLLAESHYQLGLLKESMATIDQILEIDPYNEEAKEILRRIRKKSLEKM